MNHQDAEQYLLNKPEAERDYPFGPEAAVYRVRGKMFALLSVEQGIGRINLKCDPWQAVALRDIFPAVTPGYHMNKKHWNTVTLDGSIPRGELELMMDHSYALVYQGLKKADRQHLQRHFTEEELHGRQALSTGASD
jgi:predicted DNA-binding protein (MmcQ/YjbR family)